MAYWIWGESNILSMKDTPKTVQYKIAKVCYPIANYIFMNKTVMFWTYAFNPSRCFFFQLSSLVFWRKFLSAAIENFSKTSLLLIYAKLKWSSYCSKKPYHWQQLMRKKTTVVDSSSPLSITLLTLSKTRLLSEIIFLRWG